MPETSPEVTRFFAKKVGIYEARQFRGLSDWLSKEPIKGVAYTSTPLRGPGSEPEALHVTTAVGIRRAGIGDWIVKGPRGRVQVIKESAFGATFVPVGWPTSLPPGFAQSTSISPEAER